MLYDVSLVFLRSRFYRTEIFAPHQSCFEIQSFQSPRQYNDQTCPTFKTNIWWEIINDFIPFLKKTVFYFYLSVLNQ